MKVVLIVSFLLTSGLSLSQDTTVTWIKNIDAAAFKMYFNKEHIPTEFYQVLNIRDINKIANPTDKYSPFCTNPVRGQLHWIARQGNRWVISMTYGGKSVFTKFIFLDKDKGSLNINEMNFPEPKESNTTFAEIMTTINSGQYSFED